MEGGGGGGWGEGPSPSPWCIFALNHRTCGCIKCVYAPVARRAGFPGPAAACAPSLGTGPSRSCSVCSSPRSARSRSRERARRTPAAASCASQKCCWTGGRVRHSQGEWAVIRIEQVQIGNKTGITPVYFRPQYVHRGENNLNQNRSTKARHDLVVYVRTRYERFKVTITTPLRQWKHTRKHSALFGDDNGQYFV